MKNGRFQWYSNEETPGSFGTRPTAGSRESNFTTSLSLRLFARRSIRVPWLRPSPSESRGQLQKPPGEFAERLWGDGDHNPRVLERSRPERKPGLMSRIIHEALEGTQRRIAKKHDFVPPLPCGAEQHKTSLTAPERPTSHMHQNRASHLQVVLEGLPAGAVVFPGADRIAIPQQMKHHQTLAVRDVARQFVYSRSS